MAGWLWKYVTERSTGRDDYNDDEYVDKVDDNLRKKDNNEARRKRELFRDNKVLTTSNEIQRQGYH